jgi:ABC-type transporter Mla subunit MlaD
MNHSLGLTIEALVSVLLLVTIGYCMLLNARLKRLRADEHSLKAVIAELVTATEIAERAIGGLKHTVRDVNEHLGSQLASAAQMSDQLKRQLAEGDHVVRRLSKIAIAARPQSAEAEPAAESARESAREAVKEFAREAAKETAREQFRETFRDQARETPREPTREPTREPARSQPAGATLSPAKAVAAAAQAFTERRRTGGLAA